MPARRTVVSRNVARPCGEHIRGPLGVWHARSNRATETVSRMQSCVATDSERLLRPRLGEGRKTMLTRGWCVSPVPVAVHDRFGSSVRIEEQKEKD